MRGSPLVELLLIACLFVLVLLGILRGVQMTGESGPRLPMETETKSLDGSVEINFSDGVERVSLAIKVGQEWVEVLSETQVGDTLFELLEFDVTADRIELKLLIDWNQGVSKAASELVLQVGSLPELRRTFWGSGRQVEIFSVSLSEASRVESAIGAGAKP